MYYDQRTGKPVGVKRTESNETLAHGVQPLSDAHDEQVVGPLHVELGQRAQQPGHAGVVGSRGDEPQPEYGALGDLGVLVGLRVVCGLNNISKLGRLFGLPSPVIDKEDLDQAKEFVDTVGKSTLDNYAELQEKAKMQGGAAGSQKQQEEKSMGEGYCAR